jgi:hypothetical protein
MQRAPPENGSAVQTLLLRVLLRSELLGKIHNLLVFNTPEYADSPPLEPIVIPAFDSSMLGVTFVSSERLYHFTF